MSNKLKKERICYQTDRMFPRNVTEHFLSIACNMSRIESLDQLSQPELIHHINVYNCCMSRRVSSCRLRYVQVKNVECVCAPPIQQSLIGWYHKMRRRRTSCGVGSRLTFASPIQSRCLTAFVWTARTSKSLSRPSSSPETTHSSSL